MAVLILLLAPSQLSTLVSHGQSVEANTHVYRIQIIKAATKKTVIQTGFRLKGVSGIITALHGVLGATSISARNNKNEVISYLTIAQVDIDNDLALLTYPEAERQITKGFERADGIVAPQVELYTQGFPQGIELYQKPVRAGTPVIRKLRELIPSTDIKTINEFVERRSPSLDIEVISIDGNLVKGQSGAPVLISSQNRVVGIVNGGILGGAAGISWAIPMAKVNFKLKSDKITQVQLNKLTSVNASELFESEEMVVEPITPPVIESVPLEVIVTENSSRSILNNALTLSVTDVSSNYVSGNIGSTGYRNMSIIIGRVGSSYTYKRGGNSYQIRITRIASYTSATFTVVEVKNNDLPNIENVSISSGMTETVFAGQLYVTAQKNGYISSLDPKATIILGSPSQKNKKVSGKAGHFQIIQIGADKYEVRIVKVSGFGGADLRIEKIQ